MDEFAPFIKKNTFFIVKSIVSENKVIRIFQYPIPKGETRDLLEIPGVSEADIRASLLKGEIQHKILAKEIEVVDSDIDLLQFNMNQKAFLVAAGVKKGLQVDVANFAFKRKEDIALLGAVDDVNVMFTVPPGDFFIQNDDFKIIVYKNGVKQVYLDDYLISESGGVGTGYDTVIFIVPPDALITPIDVITADYYVVNS